MVRRFGSVLSLAMMLKRDGRYGRSFEKRRQSKTCPGPDSYLLMPSSQISTQHGMLPVFLRRFKTTPVQPSMRTARPRNSMAQPCNVLEDQMAEAGEVSMLQTCQTIPELLGIEQARLISKTSEVQSLSVRRRRSFRRRRSSLQRSSRVYHCHDICDRVASGKRHGNRSRKRRHAVGTKLLISDAQSRSWLIAAVA